MAIGRTNGPLCPVSVVLSWLICRGNGLGPLFKEADGTPLSQATFMSIVRQALSKVGIDPKYYAGHSLRCGAATTAAVQGVGDATMKRLGRWHSSAYQVYVRSPLEGLASLLRMLEKYTPRAGLRSAS